MPLGQYFDNRSIIGQQLGLQAFNQQQDNEALQGATSLQQMFQNEQMNPLKVQQQSLDNQTAQAQLPGIQATSGMLQRKNSLEEEFMPQERVAKQSGYERKLSEDEVAKVKALAQQLAFHTDPKMRALGASILENDEDVIRDKAKQKYMGERQMELEKLRGANSLNTAQAMTNGRIAVKQADGGGNDKPMNMSQLEAWARRRIAEDPSDMVAAGILVGKQQDSVERATAGVQAKDELTRELIKRPDPTPAAPVSPQRYSAQPNAAPAPKQYTPGQTYSGKTGKYQYVGGDPKNPQSWKKVD